MAWPVNTLADNVDTIAAAHINSIVNAIKTWQGTVDANGNTLQNVSILSINRASTGTFNVDVYRSATGPAQVNIESGAASIDTGLRMKDTNRIWYVGVNIGNFGPGGDLVFWDGTAGAGRVRIDTAGRLITYAESRLTANVGINDLSNAPYRSLSIKGPNLDWSAANSGGGIISIGAGVGQTDNCLIMGLISTGTWPHGWIQVIKAGTASYPLLLQAAGGGVVQGCPPTAINDGFVPNNTFACYVDEATNQLRFRVRYSTGTVKQGAITLS